MPHEVSLRAAHPAVDALVGAWLTDARLVLPHPVTLMIDVAPLPTLGADTRAVFRQGRVSIRSRLVTENVVLDWEPDLGRAVLESGSTRAHVTITERGLALPNELLRSFLLNVCILLLRRVGLHHVHGATLCDPNGRGWLLVGTSGSGKSTTTSLLARHGWGVGTDDIAFLTEGSEKGTTDVVAWRERLALREDAVVAAGHEGGTSLDARRKTGWFPEELGARWIGRVAPVMLVFPAVNADIPTTAVPVRARDALSRLMRCSPWVALEADLADDHLRLMSTLVQQTRAFHVSLGRDMFERPELLSELVG